MIDVMLSFVAPAVTNFVFIGGKLNRGRDGFIGSYTNKQLEEFNFDMAFMGAVGIDVDNNKVYTYATDDAITKETIMNSSNKCYVVVENGKFSRLGNYKYATISDFDGIVTDEEPEKEIAAKIKKYDVKLIY
jgi:DeoR family glycerol-3-phosphate regulon repressor